jgi:hypothetical protein
MSEPTKEGLLARIAELVKRSEAKKSGTLEVRVKPAEWPFCGCRNIP